MWRDSIKAWYRRNRRLIQGACIAGSGSMLLLSIGSTFPTVLAILSTAQILLLCLLISILVAFLFGSWTARSTPRYPQTPLEFHQERVERAIVKEWGAAIGWLRETTAAAEETSEYLLQLYDTYLKEGGEPSPRQTTLLALHSRACDLSRAVADLCQRGHAESAFMLWRSIFEIEVNMQYIAQDQINARAERFQDWGRAAFLRIHAPDSSELKELISKYSSPDDLNRDIGWTRTRNPVGVPGRAREVGYPHEKIGRATPVLNMYEESSSYVHNDAVAILNDLGNSHPLERGPSVSGHDLPLFLTARSIVVINDALIESQQKSSEENLRAVANVARTRHTEVAFEVAMVPRRLVSRFGGLDMSIEWPTEDGGTVVAVPYRRESTVEEMLRHLHYRDQADDPDVESTKSG